MGLIEWLRGLFRSDPEKRAAAQRSHEERRRAQLEAQAERAQAEVVAKSFEPPPGGFGL